MHDAPDAAAMNPLSAAMPIRVRYAECDPMGVAHHTAYPVWFEMGRTELLRAAGYRYRDLEEADFLLAVVSLEVRYKRPARYDDELTLVTKIERLSRAKIMHSYELKRSYELLSTAQTTLACIDRNGRVQPMPPVLFDAFGMTVR